jgi:cold shock CspA family protein
MMVYVDENGNFSSTSPKEKDKTMEIDASQIDVSTPKSSTMDMDAERRGVVKFYNQHKGFGFIIPQGGQEQYFFHGTSVTGEVKNHNKIEFKLREVRRDLMQLM